MDGFLRSCGLSLVLGGGLLILIHVLLSPVYLAAFKKGEAAARTSRVYLIRIAVALVTALILIYGCIGLYLAQQHVSGLFGAIAFGVAFVGNALLFALEWSNLFVLRAVAQTHPETLVGLDKSRLVTLGFASGAGLFMLGWLLVAASAWYANVLPRWASLAILTGLILIPVLGATPLRTAGQVIGNVVFGVGVMGLGYALFQIA